MKKLYALAGAFSLVFGAPAVAQDLFAAICTPKTGEPFFVTARGQPEGRTWYIGGSATDGITADGELRLADLEDNTLLFVGGSEGTFHGVLKGVSVAGDCANVSGEFVDALKAQSPTLAEVNTRLSEKNSQLSAELQKTMFGKSEAQAKLDQCLEGSANTQLEHLNAALSVAQSQRDAAIQERDTMEAFIGDLRRSSLADGTFSTTGRAWIIQHYTALTKELGRPIHWSKRTSN